MRPFRAHSETVLPGIASDAHAEAHSAFFSPMYVLHIVKLTVADRSAEEAALSLGMLGAKIEEFIPAPAVEIQ